ncbi:MAG: GNAT family N-acetyltransferase [Reyranella sp.]
MSASIRSFQAQDLGSLFAISLATGLAGSDASRIYDDPRVMGQIYSAPYALLEPDLALVVEDGQGVAGFAVGTVDTSWWERKLDAEWWPSLRPQYVDPAGTPEASRTPDQRRAFMIHHPTPTPSAVSRKYPAHLHLNLLARLQGRGVGSMLFEAWLALAKDHGAKALHVAVNRANERAIRFWARQAFRELSLEDLPKGRTVWMGRS